MMENDDGIGGGEVLSAPIREVIRICKRIIKEVRSGECSEEEITSILANSNPSRFGYFRESDYMTADEGMRYLGLNQNRNKFFSLIKKYGIKSHTFKGIKIGYKSEEIYELKEIMAREIKLPKKGFK